MSAPVLTSSTILRVAADVLIQISSDVPNAIAASEPNIAADSQTAWDTEIWSRLSQVYKKPATCPAGPLMGIWSDITVYLLYTRHEEFLRVPPGAQKHLARIRYEDAIALLDKVAKGDAAIEGLTEATEDDVSGAGGWFSNPQVVTSRNFRGF